MEAYMRRNLFAQKDTPFMDKIFKTHTQVYDSDREVFETKKNSNYKSDVAVIPESLSKLNFL